MVYANIHDVDDMKKKRGAEGKEAKKV